MKGQTLPTSPEHLFLWCHRCLLHESLSFSLECLPVLPVHLWIASYLCNLVPSAVFLLMPIHDCNLLSTSLSSSFSRTFFLSFSIRDIVSYNSTPVEVESRGYLLTDALYSYVGNRVNTRMSGIIVHLTFTINMNTVLNILCFSTKTRWCDVRCQYRLRVRCVGNLVLPHYKL